MRLEKNNNSHIISRVAKSNLTGSRLYSFFSLLTILLAVCLVSTLLLFLQGNQTAKKRIIENMQHVMFMNVSGQQMQELSQDPHTEMLIPYKHTAEYESDSVSFNLVYFESQADKIRTYTPAQGRVPRQADEIVVDKKLMKSLGKESRIGETLSLDMNGHKQNFTICGYTENDYDTSVYAVYVSKEYADNGPEMKDLPYTALVRIVDAPDMLTSEFESTVYQMGNEYNIDRVNINLNGTFEESLQKRNANIYALLLVSVIVFAASAVVIYSIFYLSVSNRVQQIGQLQTIGMTQKQIKKMIRREGLMLGGLAIPGGLIIGGILAYFLEPDGWSITNYAVTAVIIGILALITVQLSIHKPAAIAARVSPIEAVRSTGSQKQDTVEGKPHKKLTPLRLARLNQQLDRKKWWLTTASLAFGGILFIAATSYTVSWNPEKFSRQGEFANAEYIIQYLYSAETNPKPYGYTDMQLTGHLGKDLEERLRNLPYVKEINKTAAAYANIEYQDATLGVQIIPVTANSNQYLEGVTEGNNTYEYLAEHDAILLVDPKLTEKVYGVTFHAGDKVTFNWFNGSEQSMETEIAGINHAPLSSNLESSFLMADKTIKKLWPQMNINYSFQVSVNDYEKNGEQAELDIKNILNDYPDLKLYTLRETQIDDSAQMQKLNVQIYGISAFIIMFSLLNLINTLISSISTRKKELAMLESIGMKETQIRQMLLWESFFLALPNLLITFTVGTFSGYAVVAYLKKISGWLDYQFPIVAAAVYVLGMIVVPMLTSYLCLREQNKTSLTERIKNIE